jgi:hypothetical protein
VKLDEVWKVCDAVSWIPMFSVLAEPPIWFIPPLSPIAFPLIEYTPPLKTSEPKTVPAVKSFTFDLFDALDGKNSVSPATGVPPVQFPASDQRLLDAPVHVFVDAVALKLRATARAQTVTARAQIVTTRPILLLPAIVIEDLPASRDPARSGTASGWGSPAKSPSSALMVFS